MLDDGECAKAVHFQFVNPVGIIERSGPLQERHWLEMQRHQHNQISRIVEGKMEGKRDSPFCVAQTTLRMSTQPAHLLVKSPECGRADYHIRGLPLRSW